ncbi:MAG: 1-acyl-sn-glycerol-3-phosphate acyltransferase, partial [Muribaculaceae bacterium]|nr:1-acyl-sn-glycerol-3-phosphate acyltransferase [Muribaculaceae bacterium]
MVDNHSPAAVRRTIDTARATLRDGMSIVIFPEGARTFTGKVGPFKKGAYQLALEFGLPIVPITIDGAFKVMPRTTLIPRPGHIKLTIHKPIAAPHSDDDRTEAMQLTRDTIISALPYA